MSITSYTEEYDALAKKYSLPHYSTYNSYVEISFLTHAIQDNSLIARFFRRLAEHRVESVINFFQGLLFPSGNSIIAIEEASFLDENDKQKMTEIVREGMILYRTCSLLNFSYNEAEECKKISELIAFLDNNQPAIDTIVQKINKAWAQKAKEDKSSKTTSYTG